MLFHFSDVTPVFLDVILVHFRFRCCSFRRYSRWTFRRFSCSPFARRSTSWQPFEATDFNGSSDRQCGLCSRNCERQRCVRRNFFKYSCFFKPVYHCGFKRKFYRSPAIVAGMIGLLVVSFCYWDSGWYGVPYFRCIPRVCVFSPQHDYTHVT